MFKSILVRKGKYRKRESGPTYLDENNYRLKITMHLFARKESNRNIMKHTPGLTSIEGTALNILLEKMIEDKWTKKYPSPHSKNITVYALDEKGIEVANTMKNLIDNENPILQMPMFYDVKNVYLQSE